MKQYFFFALLATTSFADITTTINIDNNSSYDMTLAYHNTASMCDQPNRQITIPARSTTSMRFCFPSSIWSSGLDAREYLEYHINNSRNRLILNAFVQTQKNDSNYTTDRFIDAKLVSEEDTIRSTPYLDNDYTHLKAADKNPEFISLRIFDHDVLPAPVVEETPAPDIEEPSSTEQS